jgi:hypothetical protein
MPPVRHNKSEAGVSPYNISKPPRQHDPPKTPEEFLKMVKSHHEDTRAQRFRCKRSQDTCEHCSEIEIHNTTGQNVLGNPVEIRTPLRFGRHQALQLSDEIECSLKVSPEYVTDNEIETRTEFQRLLCDRSDDALLQRLGRYDATCVQENEMMTLYFLFARIFFQITPSDKMDIRFAWSKALENRFFGRTHYPPYEGSYATIEIPPLNHRGSPGHGSLNSATVSRLGTLHHEVLHVYLRFYACHRCVSRREDVDQLAGHGRAWQRIAGTIECAAPHFLGLPISTCKFDTVKVHWEDMHHWPTQRDVKDWGLVME